MMFPQQSQGHAAVHRPTHTYSIHRRCPSVKVGKSEELTKETDIKKAVVSHAAFQEKRQHRFSLHILSSAHHCADLKRQVQ